MDGAPHPSSSVQAHIMEEKGAPLAIFAPGRVYRNEATDASHDFMFTQAEMKTFVNSLMKATIAQTETATATAVMGYDRAVTTFKANSVGLNRFRYAGAKDSKNRPFCRKRAKKIFTDAEAKKWRNGQKEPAFIYLGGYNCRHRKVYITF